MSICLNYVACLNIKNLIMDVFCKSRKSRLVNAENDKNTSTSAENTEEHHIEMQNASANNRIHLHSNPRIMTEPEKKSMTEFTSSIDNLYKKVIPEQRNH